MPGIKELKTRIKSIGSTRKITRAMQMVSAAKMRRAQQAALNSRTYAELAWELIGKLTGGANGVIARRSASDDEAISPPDEKIASAALAMTDTPLLLQSFPKATKTGIIVITTNTGLVGGFNSNVLNIANKIQTADVVAELFVMGRKAKDYAVRFNKNLKADFQKYDTRISIEAIYPLARMIEDLYATGEYKNISIVYNKFISTLSQKPTVKQLLPFQQASSGVIARRSASDDEAISSQDKKIAPDALAMTHKSADYLFEPTPAFVLNSLLPRIIESQIYQAVLESDAGEHSARMVTMKNATEAAGDLISDLTLTYNQLRQNKITTELAEITAGRIALE